MLRPGEKPVGPSISPEEITNFMTESLAYGRFDNLSGNPHFNLYSDNGPTLAMVNLEALRLTIATFQLKQDPTKKPYSKAASLLTKIEAYKQGWLRHQGRLARGGAETQTADEDLDDSPPQAPIARIAKRARARLAALEE